MKILLVRPKPHKETIGLQHVMVCEPLELEYLVSNIPDDISKETDVEIVDMILERVSFEKVILAKKPDFILFTGYITHVGIIKKMAMTAKQINPKVVTGVGGVHAEVVPEDFKSEFIDFIYNRNSIDNFNLTISGLINKKNVDEIKFIESRLNKKIIDSNEDISAIINWAKYK